MLSKKMTDAVNDQINAELYSAYLYLAISAWCSTAGYKGAAHWFFVQAQEETTHAIRFYNYLLSQGAPAVMDAIDKPPAAFDSLRHAVEETLKHEQGVTARIHKLADLARTEKDHATEIFLQWFVTEQVEEEESVNDVLADLRMAGDQPGGLFMIDRELGARVFTMPVGLTLG
jgi:ferritin